MPRLPDISQVNRVSSQGLRTHALSAPRVASSSALEQAGRVVEIFGDKLAKAQRATDLTNANAAAARRLKELEFSFEEDQDFATFNERFKAGSSAIQKEVSESINDETVRSAFLAQFQKSNLISEFKVRSLARKRHIDFGVASLERSLDTFGEMLTQADNDADRENLRGQAVLALSDAANTGLITQKDRATKELSFLSKAESIRARRDMIADPEAFTVDVSDPKNYPDLTEQARQRLSEQGGRLAATKERERVRLSDRTERREDKARNEAQEIRAGELMAEMLESPESVTEARLTDELSRRKIKLTQFGTLLRALKAEDDGEDEPNLLLTLTQDAIDADETVPARVASALQTKLLKKETAATILTKFDASVRRGGVLASSEAKRARSFVNDTVGGVRGPFAVLDSEASTRLAGAIREFDDRVIAGEKPFEVAEDIVPRFRLSDPGITALPRPRYLVGTRNKPDLEATMRNTVERFEAGDIDDQQFEEEAELLKKYEENEENQERRRERSKKTNERVR